MALSVRPRSRHSQPLTVAHCHSLSLTVTRCGTRSRHSLWPPRSVLAPVTHSHSLWLTVTHSHSQLLTVTHAPVTHCGPLGPSSLPSLTLHSHLPSTVTLSSHLPALSNTQSQAVIHSHSPSLHPPTHPPPSTVPPPPPSLSRGPKCHSHSFSQSQSTLHTGP